jgi:polysaccharide export outer membrane protein
MVFGHAELSGDILIDGTGTILFPFVGPIEVKDLTILECQKLIHDRLADGILNHPSVNVRISELRPLYVLGDVRTPGAYPYRYGSTVKSAVAAAGGFGVFEPLQNTAVSEFLLADERVRQLTLQKRALLVRRARIEAQRDGLDTFSPPTPSDPTEEAGVAEIAAIEKETFDSQAAMLQNQLNLLRSQKPRVQNEIDALAGQIATTKKYLAQIKQNSDQYSRLVKQGLGLTNTEMQLRLTEATQENEIWRLTAQVSRLQMDIGDLDLKINDTEAAFKRQVVAELRDVHDRLRELDVTLPSAREVREVRLQRTGGLVGAETARSISVTRTRNDEAKMLEATEMTALEPGDVIEVKKLLPRDAPHVSASLRHPGLRTNQTEAAGRDGPDGSVSRSRDNP